MRHCEYHSVDKREAIPAILASMTDLTETQRVFEFCARPTRNRTSRAHHAGSRSEIPLKQARGGMPRRSHQEGLVSDPNRARPGRPLVDGIR